MCAAGAVHAYRESRHPPPAHWLTIRFLRDRFGHSAIKLISFRGRVRRDFSELSAGWFLIVEGINQGSPLTAERKP